MTGTRLPAVFGAIPNGVLERLGKLTSKSKQLEKTKIKKICLIHCQALEIAGLAPKEFPTFLQLEHLRKQRTTKEKEDEKQEKKKKKKNR